ncbi:hypothetical protein [Ornithinimicrobium flavum]|uniref:hypothetical protein n=1 Tax=Ornithinimicrobium flavum TaxID=1288636 RepID=UPI00106FA39E|nr:hypothetical protein [Ornithinimicrobium flavum]
MADVEGVPAARGLSHDQNLATSTPSATSVATGTGQPSGAPADGPDHPVKRTLWFGAAALLIVALYVLTERSVWFQELPELAGLFGRVTTVTLIVGLAATLNPWKAQTASTDV